MHIPTFLRNIHHPHSHPNAIHPALMNAIFLGACSVGGGKMKTYESLFLKRARGHLEQSLAYADRLEQFMWAHVVLSPYYGRNGRLLEAQQYTSTTVRFAVACGLHKDDGEANPLLAPPENGIEAVERYNLWGAIYLTHTITRTFTEDPNSVPEEVQRYLSCHDVIPYASSYV